MLFIVKEGVTKKKELRRWQKITYNNAICYIFGLRLSKYGMICQIKK